MGVFTIMSQCVSIDDASLVATVAVRTDVASVGTWIAIAIVSMVSRWKKWPEPYASGDSNCVKASTTKTSSSNPLQETIEADIRIWQWSAVAVDKENRVVVWNELDMTSALYVV